MFPIKIKDICRIYKLNLYTAVLAMKEMGIEEEDVPMTEMKIESLDIPHFLVAYREFVKLKSLYPSRVTDLEINKSSMSYERAIKINT